MRSDQQQVFYTVSSEDGKTQQYMMLCPKDMDQNTLITALVRTISADPNNKGKKTIRITQRKSSPEGMFLLFMSTRIHLVAKMVSNRVFLSSADSDT